MIEIISFHTKEMSHTKEMFRAELHDPHIIKIAHYYITNYNCRPVSGHSSNGALTHNQIILEYHRVVH